MTYKLSQVKTGSFPQTSLAMACMKLQELKRVRSEGRCPASELKDEKLRALKESQKQEEKALTVEGLAFRPGLRKFWKRAIFAGYCVLWKNW